MSDKGTTKNKGNKVSHMGKPKAKVRKFVAGETYQFKGSGKAPSLTKGMVYTVTSMQAELFTKNGYGEVID